MKKVLSFTHRKQSLKRELFAYMFVLVGLLVLLLLIGMYLLGSYTGTKRRVAETLKFQAQVFEQQVTSHYNNLAVMGIQLSEHASGCIDRYLAENELKFDALNNSQTHIAGVQEALIEPLQRKLLEADCSGAFLLLDAQVNSAVENAATSRSGLYLQRNSLDSTDTRILLYRGIADIGKRHDAMPHRKWRQEFDTVLFPEYDLLAATAALPTEQSYRLTEAVLLPGTSEHVMLMTLPIVGEDGTYYGLCGFEISESYFKHIFAQPSELTHAIFCLSSGQFGLTDADASLSAGIVNDYYLAPDGQFRSAPFGSGLYSCESDVSAYVGIIRSVRLTPGGEAFSLSTLMLRQDYDRISRQDAMKFVLLLTVFAAFAAVCCLYFSRWYLRPIKQSLALIRQKEYTESRYTEIDDLFAYLAAQDRQQEAALNAAQEENASMQAELVRRRSEQSQAELELQRLAYSRKKEVDPDDYENFRRGLQNLTPTERRVFDYYLDGKSVKEITELMGVKESTIRFHNRNIYVALGVNSLKQMLRCAAILKQETAAHAAESTDEHAPCG